MRLAVAGQRVVDETLAAKVDGYRTNDLPAAHKAALALADALMTQPGQIGPQLVAELKRHFTDQQLVEITVDVMKWNGQKVPVALGTDAALDDELTDLVFDERGNWVR